MPNSDSDSDSCIILQPVSDYNCTAPDSQCGKSLIRAFEIKNDRETKNLNESNGSYQLSDGRMDIQISENWPQ